jgi:4a-hydroxytetrahydrobiopterin dehydratase
MEKLKEDQIRERLQTLDGWNRNGDAIEKTFVFESFGDAIGFVNRVAALAEAADHHPDFRIEYTKVTLTLSTHSAGGITAADTGLAARIG